jgi:hypothetical protein
MAAWICAELEHVLAGNALATAKGHRSFNLQGIGRNPGAERPFLARQAAAEEGRSGTGQASADW